MEGKKEKRKEEITHLLTYPVYYSYPIPVLWKYCTFTPLNTENKVSMR